MPATVNLDRRIDGAWRDLIPTSARDHVTHTLQRRAQLHQASDPVAVYLDSLAALDLDDPTGAAEPYHRALELRTEARNLVPVVDQRRKLTHDLAAGDVTPDEATDRLVELEGASADVRAAREARKRTLRDAADVAYLDAARRIHAAGDALIVELLRPVVRETLSRPQDHGAADRYDAAHHLAHHLRSSTFAPSCGAKIHEHAFARPDLVHAWRLDHAAKARTVSTLQEPGVTHVVRLPVNAPALTLAVAVDHPEWEPDLYTAAEVVDHLGASAERGDLVTVVA